MVASVAVAPDPLLYPELLASADPASVTQVTSADAPATTDWLTETTAKAEPVEFTPPPVSDTTSGSVALALDALRAGRMGQAITALVTQVRWTPDDSPAGTLAATSVFASTMPLPGSTTFDIPPLILAAYQNAARLAGTVVAGCDVPWYVLAGIGRVESHHGLHWGTQTVFNPDGLVSPRIIGPVLDGNNGTAAISDTDGGRWEGDTVWDHAVGPMQFIPSTWASHGADGNGDGIADPHNAFDAALSAAAYLCRAAPGDYSSDPAQLGTALFAYNHSWDYVQTVSGWIAAYQGIDPDSALYVANLPDPPSPSDDDGSQVAVNPAPTSPDPPDDNAGQPSGSKPSKPADDDLAMNPPEEPGGQPPGGPTNPPSPGMTDPPGPGADPPGPGADPPGPGADPPGPGADPPGPGTDPPGPGTDPPPLDGGPTKPSEPPESPTGEAPPSEGPTDPSPTDPPGEPTEPPPTGEPEPSEPPAEPPPFVTTVSGDPARFSPYCQPDPVALLVDGWLAGQEFDTALERILTITYAGDPVSARVDLYEARDLEARSDPPVPPDARLMMSGRVHCAEGELYVAPPARSRP